MISDPEDWDKMVENNEDTQSLFEIKVVGQKFHIKALVFLNVHLFGSDAMSPLYQVEDIIKTFHSSLIIDPKTRHCSKKCVCVCVSIIFRCPEIDRMFLFGVCLL